MEDGADPREAETGEPVAALPAESPPGVSVAPGGDETSGGAGGRDETPGAHIEREETPAAELKKKSDDLEAISSAVADAGGVGAGLWITYLSLLFYLAIAAGAVTHRDLLLENPVKLPFLNVDLPLVAFFALAPLLFVVTHLYTLLNFNLLAAKVQRFEEALAAQTSDETVRGRMRGLLPNNILIQYLARPTTAQPLWPLLWLIVTLTLVVAPIALLVFLQIQFLPYHHYVVLWVQRIILICDGLLLWRLWPPAPRASGAALRKAPGWRIAAPAAGAAVLCLMTVASLPGEPQAVLHDLLFGGAVDMVRGRPAGWFSNFLVLPDFVANDRSKSDKPAATEDTVSISLRGRDLDGAIFIRAELRSADFTGASLRNARFDDAILTRARFGRVTRDEAASANLEGASFRGARAERAQFEGANLRGVDFDYARLQGSSFYRADLRGSHMDKAELQGANLVLANIQAGWLSHSDLEGASLASARLEAEPIFDAQVQAANFEGAKLQGADLRGSSARAASFALASVWRSDFSGAGTGDPIWTDSIQIDKPQLCQQPTCPDDPKALSNLLGAAGNELPEGLVRTEVLGWLRRLNPAVALSDDAKKADVWRAIAARQPSIADYRRALASELQRIGCDSSDPPFVIEGLIDNGRIADTGPEAAGLSSMFANEQKCPGARGLSAAEKDRLRGIAESAAAPPKNDGI